MTDPLRKAGHHVQQRGPNNGHDEGGVAIGNYYAGLLIEDGLLGELKAAETSSPEHEAQILGYLKATQVEHGVLINYGADQFQIRKYRWACLLYTSRCVE